MRESTETHLLIAGDAWRAELRRAYGNYATAASLCDSGHGAPGTALRKAWNEYRHAKTMAETETQQQRYYA